MIRTTIIGGALFLLPLVIVTFVLGKAFQLSLLVAKPIGKIIPIEHFYGVAAVNVVAIVLILLVCYGAGMLARSPAVRDRVGALDRAMVGSIPAYAMVKTMLSSVGSVEAETDALRPVLVALDDATSIAFEVERREDKVVVFLPGSPSPWSGSTAIVDAARVTPLQIPSHQVAKLVQMFGRGSFDAIERSRAGTATRATPSS